ncbi:MAG TPA: NCS2 family permease [Candidatus Faeciplasma pullistercoris]|uniref:NCS2 family permease n=1 Tax=Candidatus Faeciplasma pullistercoris TaxID=2840800 RepID=A0A9D1KKQ6_9FIRM|nr:NCS2 family permease [Candidatus Faeciplasma pullistercoris]
MDKFFKISERGSNVRTEIFGGLTTFFAMAYIVFVNPNQVAAEGANGWLAAEGANAAALGQVWNSVFVASILVAFIGTLLYAVYAKLPYAQACGMGLNSFFCTCFVSGAYFAGVDIIDGYHSGMVIVFISGLIFITLSITGARQYVAKAMPDCLKKAIPAGIGLFIAFIGFQNVDIIQPNQYTLLQFVDINGAIKSGDMSGVIPALLALLGLIIIAILAKYKVKGNVILGILITTVLYYVATWQLPSFDVSSIEQSFKDFGEIGITGIFQGQSWVDAFGGAHIGGIFNAIVLIITFCLVDMFDTIGTLYGAASEANMLDKNGDPIDIDKAMVCDSTATITGAVLGTSTCTTFVESSAGVAAGARSGLASLVTSLCFLACLFLTPLASIIPSCATAPALIYVGVLMLKSFGKVDMTDVRNAVPAFLALIMMPLTYSIANGIGIGAISYVLITLFTGNYKKKDIVITIIAVLFIFKFVTITM